MLAERVRNESTRAAFGGDEFQTSGEECLEGLKRLLIEESVRFQEKK
jgi:hypothetical protein